MLVEATIEAIVKIVSPLCGRRHQTIKSPVGPTAMISYSPNIQKKLYFFNFNANVTRLNDGLPVSATAYSAQTIEQRTCCPLTVKD